MAKVTRHPAQADLFEVSEWLPVLEPTAMPAAEEFNRKLAAAMGEAIRVSRKTREMIAAEMTALLGEGPGSVVTVAMLNAYTSPARKTHNISVVRFAAFVRATEAAWLYDLLLKPEGLVVLQGDEVHLARASLLEKQGRMLIEQAEAERAAAPATLRSGRVAR